MASCEGAWLYSAALTPLVTDDDEGTLPPLLAIDRIQLATGESTLRRPRSAAAAAANELAPFVSVAWDPGCRERVFCCAGGAIHGTPAHSSTFQLTLSTFRGISLGGGFSDKTREQNGSG